MPILSRWLSLAWTRDRARQLSLVSARFGGPSQRASRAWVLRISCRGASRVPAIGGRFSICGSIGGSWAAAAGARIRYARMADMNRTLFIVRDFYLNPTACQGTAERRFDVRGRSASLGFIV